MPAYIYFKIAYAYINTDTQKFSDAFSWRGNNTEIFKMIQHWTARQMYPAWCKTLTSADSSSELIPAWLMFPSSQQQFSTW